MSAGKEFACNAGDLCSIPGLGSSPGEGKGYPLQLQRVRHDRATFTSLHFILLKIPHLSQKLIFLLIIYLGPLTLVLQTLLAVQGPLLAGVTVQLINCVQLFLTPWTVAHQASQSFAISQSFLKLMSIDSVMLSNHLIFCCPLLLLPSILPKIRGFSSESALSIMWSKYWSFSFSISPSNEYSGLISFRMDWLDLLSVQGTLKSLLQHHS